MPDLTKQDATRWAICRKVAKDGLDTYWEVGRALLEIKESRLYQMEFATFEGYCKTELNVSKAHAYRLIKGVNILEGEMSPIGDKNTPDYQEANEAQTRELAKAEPEDRSELWGDAVESAGDGPVTAKHVKEAVEAKKPKPKDLSKVEQSMAEATDAFAPAMATVRAARRQVDELLKTNHTHYLHAQRIQGDLKNASNALNHAKPRSKCPGCGGTGRKACGQCKGVGWVGKTSYDQSPRELKAALDES